MKFSIKCTFTFFWIFLLIRQNKIKHHSVTNHIYENITRLETFGVMKIIVKFLNISIYVILDSTLLSFALLWMFWFWQFTTHKRVKLCHVINMYANMSKDQQCTAYISILLLKFLPVKKRLVYVSLFWNMYNMCYMSGELSRCPWISLGCAPSSACHRLAPDGSC